MSLAKRKLRHVYLYLWRRVTIKAASVNLNQLVYGELTGKCVERESYRDCKTRPVDFRILLTAKQRNLAKHVANAIEIHGRLQCKIRGRRHIHKFPA